MYRTIKLPNEGGKTFRQSTLSLLGEVIDTPAANVNSRAGSETVSVGVECSRASVGREQCWGTTTCFDMLTQLFSATEEERRRVQ